MILNVDGEEGQSIPLIVDSPHSGINYPSDFNHQAEFSKLRQAEDSYVDELYNFVSEIGGVILNANFPRSYIDPNRAETDFPIPLELPLTIMHLPFIKLLPYSC